MEHDSLPRSRLEGNMSLSNEKRGPGLFRVFWGDGKLPSYVWIVS